MTREVTTPPRRPLRVVHVSCHCDTDERTPEQLLAAWPTLLGVARGLSGAGLSATIVQASRVDRTLDVDGIPVHFVAGQGRALSGKRGGTLLRASGALLKRVVDAQPDIIHVNGVEHPLAIHQLATTFASTPVLVQDHASAAPIGWRTTLFRWAVRPVAAAIFTVEDQAVPFAAARVFPLSLPIHEVFEGSSTFLPGDRSEARMRTGLRGDPCLLWTGHLDPNKDPLMVLAAFERAAPRLPDARLWCCFGSAPLFDAVKQRIDASAVLRERVTLLGPQPHAAMETLFRAADFFVQASHREGCSYSTIEALACGTPPLVTDIPSTRRIVGDAGSLTPVDDAEAFGDAIVEWSRGDRERGRAAARARFERELTYEAIGRELRAVYESVLLTT
jgi:Glycosyltransferase